MSVISIKTNRKRPAGQSICLGDVQNLEAMFLDGLEDLLICKFQIYGIFFNHRLLRIFRFSSKFYGFHPLAFNSSFALREKLKSKTSLTFISRVDFVVRFMSSISGWRVLSSLMPLRTAIFSSVSLIDLTTSRSLNFRIAII